MPEDKFTLEKLRISERLGEINQNIAVLTQRLTDYMDKNENAHKNIWFALNNHQENLHGDGNPGNPGIIVRLDRVEQLEEERTAHRKITYAAMFGLLIEHLRHIFTGGK